MEMIKEGAERFDAVVQLERCFIFAEIFSDFTSKLVKLRDVTL